MRNLCQRTPILYRNYKRMTHEDALQLIQAMNHQTHVIDVDLCCIIIAMFIIYALNDIFGKK